VALFDNRQAANLRSAVSLIEEVLAALGHPPDQRRIDAAGDASPTWCVVQGSARTYVLLQDRDGENVLRVIAPVLHLDGVADPPALFRRLLELNAEEIQGAAFAVHDGIVSLVAQRSTADLDRSEVRALVERIPAYADRYDDELAAEFGGRPAGASAAPVS
jgi:hypothetical protein